MVYGALSRMSAEADRGWSLGLAGAIGGLGQFIAVPGTQALQDALGWDQTLVTLGALMLSIMLIRVIRGHFSPEQHFGFEAAAWYWHFVDVVWIGLFVFVYVL